MWAVGSGSLLYFDVTKQDIKIKKKQMINLFFSSWTWTATRKSNLEVPGTINFLFLIFLQPIFYDGLPLRLVCPYNRPLLLLVNTDLSE